MGPNVDSSALNTSLRWHVTRGKSALLITGLIALASTLATPQVFGQSSTPTTDSELTEVIVTGTRQSGVKSDDSAAPIEVVGSGALVRTGATDLADALSASVPSFNVQMNAGEAAALTIQAALRGVSPNDTLILVNGKRRHTTANLGVSSGTAYSGAATTDLSFIPVGAIDHVEVLTDGASAQYGSDAIAGVVNIILKKSATGGALMATGGAYYDGEGQTGSWSVNKGLQLGDRGFFNVTVEQRYHDYSVEGTGDYRYQAPSGALLPGLSFPNSNIVNAQNFPHENRAFGDPSYNFYDSFYNAGYDFDGGIELYSFGSYGQGKALKYQNYRAPNNVEATTSTGVTVYPLLDGYDPAPKIDEDDYSFTGGVKGSLYGWNWDLSTTYGGNNDRVYTVNSANGPLFADLQAQSATPIPAQQNFYDGTFKESEWTNNIDLDRSFEVGLRAPLNIALGAEWRRDTYAIAAGEPASYFSSGASAFPGYTPLDQGQYSRTNYAGYVDVAVNPIDRLHTDIAVRYENYSDFGDTTSGKFTARYDFDPAFAIRGTVSNGFRAPTLAEEYYSGTNVGANVAVFQFPGDSAAARYAGFPNLKPELSNNYSLGFVAHPVPKLQITGDIYDISIRDRILVSGLILGETLGPTGILNVSQNILNSIAVRGVTLSPDTYVAGVDVIANAANTRTEGAELTANYSSDFGDFGKIDWSLGFNYNKTDITKSLSLPTADQNAGQGQTAFLSPSAATALTTSVPREKVILQALWTYNQFIVNLRETVYGPTSQLQSFADTGTGAGTVNETIGVTGITDVTISYRLTKALRFDIGADDLFNKIAPAPKVDTAANRPFGGQDVYSVPYIFSPWNTNGGYYYGRVTYAF